MLIYLRKIMSKYRLFGWLALPLVLIACTAPAPVGPTATAVPAPTAAEQPTLPAATPTLAATVAPRATPTLDQLSDDELLKASQDVLDTYAKAYNTNDPELLRSVVDQTNLPFRRLVQGRFDTFQQSINAGQSNTQFKAVSVKRRDLGFIQVHLTRFGCVGLVVPMGQWAFSAF
jgi:hypothetical protein